MLRKVLMTVAFAAGLAANAFAADVAKDEVSIAATHANYSSQSKDIAGVHLHLHHVLNCLVGSDDDGFDAGAGNPCQGKGAIHDATDNGFKWKLLNIVAQAKTGIADDNLASAQATASKVHAMLQDALAGH